MKLLRHFQDELEKFAEVVRACPDDLWEANLWKVNRLDPWMWPRDQAGELLESSDREQDIQVFSAFWYVAYHCLFYLDLYLTSDSTNFETPPPFGGPEEHGVDEDMAAVLPYRVYSKRELLNYLAHGRRKAEEVLPALSEDDQRQPTKGGHPWAGQPFNIVLRVNLKHVREHRVQLEKYLAKSLSKVSAKTS